MYRIISSNAERREQQRVAIEFDSADRANQNRRALLLCWFVYIHVVYLELQSARDSRALKFESKELNANVAASSVGPMKYRNP